MRYKKISWFYKHQLTEPFFFTIEKRCNVTNCVSLPMYRGGDKSLA